MPRAGRAGCRRTLATLGRGASATTSDILRLILSSFSWAITLGASTFILSLDHLAALAASLDEGNPSFFRLSDMVTSSIAGIPSVDIVGPSLLASLCREGEDVDPTS